MRNGLAAIMTYEGLTVRSLLGSHDYGTQTLVIVVRMQKRSELNVWGER